MRDVTRLSAFEAAQEIADGRLTSESLVRALLERIAQRDGAVSAWTHLDPDAVLAEARQRDGERARGPFHGVPVGIKDIIDTHDMPTGYGSAIYAGHRPAWDAACVALLREGGMVVMGKTVSTEFALRTPGPTRNPHDPARTPGGSSSGSAAAVADFQVPLAVGTQTGGSVIRPASFCGVVGYKPTAGRIPRAGVKPISETLDTVGVFARDVRDAGAFAAILECAPVQSLPVVDKPPTFGFCRTPVWENAELSTRRAMKQASDLIRDAGGTIVDIELAPEFREAAEAHSVIQSYEGWRSLAFELKSHDAALSVALKDYLAPGAEHTREHYDWARKVQATCRALFWQVFQDIDAVITPAAPGEAPANLAFTGSPIFNKIWTMLGVPAVTVPGIAGPAGMPIGVQVIGLAGHALETLAHADWLYRVLAKEER